MVQVGNGAAPSAGQGGQGHGYALLLRRGRRKLRALSGHRRLEASAALEILRLLLSAYPEGGVVSHGGDDAALRHRDAEVVGRRSEGAHAGRDPGPRRMLRQQTGSDLLRERTVWGSEARGFRWQRLHLRRENQHLVQSSEQGKRGRI